ncbi:MAG TPA: single-stranded DNA-binding protein [Lachnospiraceae bacterium]|nr:single-stranded DNA-binding protein [Lachnospiraceae bacterium]
MNKVILAGRLTADPEIRYTQSADSLAVCRFSIAVDRGRRQENGERTADFFNCTCFGKRGETINQFFRKGNRIAVAGRIQNDNYTDKDGVKRYSVQIIVEEFDFLESKSEAAASSQGNFNQSSGSVPSGNDYSGGFHAAADDANDDDLPF